MKSITIHGIEAELDKQIAKKAAETGLSQNKTVKSILRSCLLSDKKATKREAFSDLFGKWSREEKEEFNQRIKELETVDERHWEM